VIEQKGLYSVKNIKQALEEAYEVLCKTGDHTQWVAAFEAAYGKNPVYIPQH
jgi:hypothetical protein